MSDRLSTHGLGSISTSPNASLRKNWEPVGERRDDGSCDDPTPVASTLVHLVREPLPAASIGFWVDLLVALYITPSEVVWPISSIQPRLVNPSLPASTEHIERSCGQSSQRH